LPIFFFFFEGFSFEGCGLNRYLTYPFFPPAIDARAPKKLKMVKITNDIRVLLRNSG
jgi:hypothetical protein